MKGHILASEQSKASRMRESGNEFSTLRPFQLLNLKSLSVRSWTQRSNIQLLGCLYDEYLQIHLHWHEWSTQLSGKGRISSHQSLYLGQTAAERWSDVPGWRQKCLHSPKPPGCTGCIKYHEMLIHFCICYIVYRFISNNAATCIKRKSFITLGREKQDRPLYSKQANSKHCSE